VFGRPSTWWTIEKGRTGGNMTATQGDLAPEAHENEGTGKPADKVGVLAQEHPGPCSCDAATREAIRERRRRLIEDISRAWPKGGMSAAEAVADQRRDV
jgi:hypothetical protein